MAAEIEVPITYGAARQMAVAAAEASEMSDGNAISTTHVKVMEIMSRRLVDGLTAGTTASVFAVRDGDTVATHLSLQVTTLEAYLETLDVIATQTPRPHVRNNCQWLFTHLTDHVDVDALGLRLENYDTLSIKPGNVFG